MLFSIIVPIYNVEKYLSQCIESVLNQSYSDFELILVDDGSPDKSGTICDNYALMDRRIKIIHKMNGGVSSARNVGIEVAEGEYILFLDSDDYLACSALGDVAIVIKRNEWIDMLTCAHISDYSDGNTKSVLLPFDPSETCINRNEYLYKLYKSNGAYWAPWENIYRKSIIEKSNLRFSKDLICAEDCDFFMRFVQLGKKFSYLNIPVVYYRINRVGSITNTMSRAAIISQLAVFIENYIKFESDDYKNQKVFFANKFANTVSCLYHLKVKTDIDQTLNYIRTHKDILKKTKGLKYSVAKVVWSIFGYYKGSKVLQKINPKVILN